MPASFQILPLSSDLAQAVRDTMKAPGYGHPAHRDVAVGYGPCRVCLQPFQKGEEERILFTHDPFAGCEPFPLPGPVYIHARICAPYADVTHFPDALRFIPITLNAYARERLVKRQARITDGRVEPVLEHLFEDPDVAYVHIRNTEAGCYIARAVRISERPEA